MQLLIFIHVTALLKACDPSTSVIALARTSNGHSTLLHHAKLSWGRDRVSSGRVARLHAPRSCMRERRIHEPIICGSWLRNREGWNLPVSLKQRPNSSVMRWARRWEGGELV